MEGANEVKSGHKKAKCAVNRFKIVIDDMKKTPRRSVVGGSTDIWFLQVWSAEGCGLHVLGQQGVITTLLLNFLKFNYVPFYRLRAIHGTSRRSVGRMDMDLLPVSISPSLTELRGYGRGIMSRSPFHVEDEWFMGNENAEEVAYCQGRHKQNHNKVYCIEESVSLMNHSQSLAGICVLPFLPVNRYTCGLESFLSGEHMVTWCISV